MCVYVYIYIYIYVYVSVCVTIPQQKQHILEWYLLEQYN